MANGRHIPFAGVAQSPERRSARPEVGGKNPPPRSKILPFPRRPLTRLEPFVIAIAGTLVGIAIVVIGLAGYAASIVLRGLP